VLNEKYNKNNRSIMNKYTFSPEENKCRPTLFLAGCGTVFAERERERW
jgi:hypothetical protein